MKFAKDSIIRYISSKNLPSPREEGSCEEIGLVLFRVIPAKAGVRRFRGVTNTLDPGFHRGDEYWGIFSQLQGNKGRGGVEQIA
jgi:hypothetical protein